MRESDPDRPDGGKGAKPGPSRTRGLLIYVLGLGLAVIPLAWILGRVEVGEVLAHTRRIGLVNFSGCLLLLLLASYIGALRWRQVMVAYGSKGTPTLRSLFRRNLIALYFNALPSGFVGDGVRGYQVRDYHPDLTTAFAVAFVDRFIGLVTLILVGVAARLASTVSIDASVSFVIDLSMGLALLGSSVVLVLPWVLEKYASARAMVARIPVAGPLFMRVPPASTPLSMVAGAGTSMVVHASALCGMYFLIPSSAELPAYAAVRVLPFMLLFISVPITPAAIGQREAVFAYFLNMVGFSTAVATAVAFAFFGTQIVLAIVGGLCYLPDVVGRRRRGRRG